MKEMPGCCGEILTLFLTSAQCMKAEAEVLGFGIVIFFRGSGSYYHKATQKNIHVFLL